MPTLVLKLAESGTASHGDEVLACAYAPDGRQAVSGGWDGQLRIWNALSGAFQSGIQVGKKPVSAVAVSPDGRQFLTGTLEGMLTQWDAESQERISTFLAHSRPVSSIAFLHGGQTIVTGSWDQKVILWKGTQPLRTLDGHGDVVSGCQASLDEKSLVSWSYDQVVVVWDIAGSREPVPLHGHADRILAGAISPDNRWVASGSRDGAVILWDVAAQRQQASLCCKGEVRLCAFLRDGESLIVADTSGRVALHGLPDLETRSELQTGEVIQSGALAPAGSQLALGCGDGRVHLVDVEGFDQAPLLITIQKAFRREATLWERWRSKSHEVAFFQGFCPCCLMPFEISDARPGALAVCAKCQRKLTVAHILTPT